MRSRLHAAADRIRRPEYTGENRCLPCTAANLAIAAVGSLLLGGLSPVLGFVGFSLAVAVIWLRGYLVPGTPELTRQYFPGWLLRAFEKDPRAATFDAETATDGEFEPERFLRETGLLVDDPQRGDVAVDPAFGAAWRERMEAVDSEAERSELAALLGVDPDRLDLTRHGNAVAARLDGRRIGQWESDAAFVADLAGARELADRLDGWSSLPVGQRSGILGVLRLCLDTCPDCGGVVGLETDVVQSCCRSVDVVAANCQDCGARIFEAEWDPEGPDAGWGPDAGSGTA